MSDPADSPDPEDDPEAYESSPAGATDSHDPAERERPADVMHQTNFHGPVSGPTHTGSGDIIEQQTNIYGEVSGPILAGMGNIYTIRLFSPAEVKRWLAAIFRWSEAPRYSGDSWAGLVLWSLSTVYDRINPQTLLAFLVALALWLVTAWLLAPLLQWPLADPQARLVACIHWVIASLAIPLIAGSLTGADNESHFQITTNRGRARLWLLKFTGAAVGFGTFALLLLFLALVVYYVTLSTLPVWAWWILALAPLLFSHIVARRIPADRYQMFGGKLQLHNADALFLVVFSCTGVLAAAFVYFFYESLAEQFYGFVFLLLLIGLVLWEYRKRFPAALSDLQLIMIIGLLLPLAILLSYVLFSEQFATIPLATTEERLAALLVVEYVFALTLLGTTLLVRNRPVLTLRGVFAMLAILVVLNAILAINLAVGRWTTLATVLLWLVWGRRYFRNHLWVHASFLVLLVAIGLSLYLVAQGLLPLWANVLGFAVMTIVLVRWAYRSSSQSAAKSK